MATVQLDGVTKSYGAGPPAVDHIDLAIADGEFMVLLGPSGCGKSTTLRMIAGIESITAGRLSIDGHVVNDVPAKDRDIAMVFQSYALYPHMTVADNLAFGLRRRAVPRAEIVRRVHRVAGLPGLTPYIARKPAALSGGQRQRVATRNELIRQHHRLGATMIYVTHDQVEAMTMGSRISVMNAGRVVQVGSPLEVYWNPVDTFVARFLGAPLMNLLDLPVAGAPPLASADWATVPLTQWHPATLARYVGQRLTIGVRAEDLRLGAGSGEAGWFRGRIDAIEPLGAEALVMVSAGGVEVTARLGRDVSARVGETVSLGFDADAVYLFDPATTCAIRKDAR